MFPVLAGAARTNSQGFQTCPWSCQRAIYSRHRVTIVDLRDWLDDMHIRIDQLDDLFGDEADLDFSPESLSALEAALLNQFEELPDPGAEPIAAYAADYLGEMLLRITGGGWVAIGDVPVINPDAALGLAQLAPLELVRTAIERRTGHEFHKVRDDWADTARKYARAHPGWLPDKETTPGLEHGLPERSTELAAWLAQREREFPAWRERFGGNADWDFSANSIDALTAAVFRETPTRAHFREHPEFIDGAVWYWGEVLRRPVAGSWQHTPGERDGLSPLNGYFWVYRPDVEYSFTPELNLVSMVEREDQRRLHTIFENWSS